MTWNFDVSEAPKGRTVERAVTTEKGKVPYEAFEHDHVILASKCGKVMRSYWIPDENRWCMLSKHEAPVAWMHWPEHPASKAISSAEEKQGAAS